MTTNTIARIIIVALILAVLGGASLIIAKNGAGSSPETPSGFFH